MFVNVPWESRFNQKRGFPFKAWKFGTDQNMVSVFDPIAIIPVFPNNSEIDSCLPGKRRRGFGVEETVSFPIKTEPVISPVPRNTPPLPARPARAGLKG